MRKITMTGVLELSQLMKEEISYKCTIRYKYAALFQITDKDNERIVLANNQK